MSDQIMIEVGSELSSQLHLEVAASTIGPAVVSIASNAASMPHEKPNCAQISSQTYTTPLSGDSFSGLFEPDVVLPEQFHDTRDSGLDGGERKLMAALLADGIEAYLSQVTGDVIYGRTGKSEATEWVENRDHSYVFSFDVVCESLGINPEYLRLGLGRYVNRVKHEHSVKGEAVAWKKIRRPRKS